MRPASTPRLPVTARVFVQRFSSTPRGARLARHLALYRLDAWGVPYGSAVSDTAALLVAELAANAVTHGRVPGRDIEVLLRLDAYTLRIDVSDSRGERRPCGPESTAAPEAEHGRGLLLVDALADRWGVFDRSPVGKTVRAELDLPARASGRTVATGLTGGPVPPAGRSGR
ncbi:MULTISPECIES: ATP-binding protein [Streptomyces]|uniref:ATP-binding protein n=1 Tax=Streptomyces TaxID=1883 RepID=UPI000FD78946|nr:MULTISPECIES: ATP-binding protein [unclassified Streptomyces]MCW1097376.1 ATP-binding protein [Streptomyces sp. RS2]